MEQKNQQLTSQAETLTQAQARVEVLERAAEEQTAALGQAQTEVKKLTEELAAAQAQPKSDPAQAERIELLEGQLVEAQKRLAEETRIKQHLSERLKTRQQQLRGKLATAYALAKTDPAAAEKVAELEKQLAAAEEAIKKLEAAGAAAALRIEALQDAAFENAQGTVSEFSKLELALRHSQAIRAAQAKELFGLQSKSFVWTSSQAAAKEQNDELRAAKERAEESLAAIQEKAKGSSVADTATAQAVTGPEQTTPAQTPLSLLGHLRGLERRLLSTVKRIDELDAAILQKHRSGTKLLQIIRELDVEKDSTLGDTAATLRQSYKQVGKERSRLTAALIEARQQLTQINRELGAANSHIAELLQKTNPKSKKS